MSPGVVQGDPHTEQQPLERGSRQRVPVHDIPLTHKQLRHCGSRWKQGYGGNWGSSRHGRFFLRLPDPASAPSRQLSPPSHMSMVLTNLLPVATGVRIQAPKACSADKTHPLTVELWRRYQTVALTPALSCKREGDRGTLLPAHRRTIDGRTCAPPQKRSALTLTFAFAPRTVSS